MSYIEPAPIKDKENPFESTMPRFQIATEHLGFNQQVYDVLKSPAKQVIVTFPITMDNWQIEVFEGYGLIHSNILGSSKGCIRMDMKAKLIVEGTNGPTSVKADEKLNDLGRLLVPKILANAGDVTVSYFEWIQNRLGYKCTGERFNMRSDRIMKDVFNRVYEIALQYDVSLHILAYIVGIDKVAKTYTFIGGF